MDQGLDTGDMILKEEVELAPQETGGSLFDRLAQTGAALCVRTLEAIEDGTAVYTPQDHEAATHTMMIKKQLGKIDWNRPAQELECLIRGLNPWPSAYTSLNGKTLKISASFTGGNCIDFPLPLGLSGCVTASTISCPALLKASKVPTAKSGVPIKITLICSSILCILLHIQVVHKRTL